MDDKADAGQPCVAPADGLGPAGLGRPAKECHRDGLVAHLRCVGALGRRVLGSVKRGVLSELLIAHAFEDGARLGVRALELFDFAPRLRPERDVRVEATACHAGYWIIPQSATACVAQQRPRLPQRTVAVA